MEFIDAKKNNFNLSYFGVKMSFVDACYDVLTSLGQPFVFAIEVSEAWVSVLENALCSHFLPLLCLCSPVQISLSVGVSSLCSSTAHSWLSPRCAA